MSEDAHARPTRDAPEPLYDVNIPTPTHAERARTLVAQISTGTLCTLALEPDGYPYDSFVTVAVDNGNPIVLISRLPSTPRAWSGILAHRCWWPREALQIWHLDELCLMINGQRGWLWRAVDDAGEVLDVLVQRRRSARAAKRFFRKLLKGFRMVPCAIVTDRLASYAAAKAVAMPTVAHLRGWRQNKPRRELHQPVRRRERGLQRFKSLRHAARFCSVFSTVCNQFRPGRHALSAPNYRTVMRRRWREWDIVAETTAFADAA